MAYFCWANKALRIDVIRAQRGIKFIKCSATIACIFEQLKQIPIEIWWGLQIISESLTNFAKTLLKRSKNNLDRLSYDYIKNKCAKQKILLPWGAVVNYQARHADMQTYLFTERESLLRHLIRCSIHQNDEGILILIKSKSISFRSSSTDYTINQALVMIMKE